MLFLLMDKNELTVEALTDESNSTIISYNQKIVVIEDGHIARLVVEAMRAGGEAVVSYDESQRYLMTTRYLADLALNEGAIHTEEYMENIKKVGQAEAAILELHSIG